MLQGIVFAIRCNIFFIVLTVYEVILGYKKILNIKNSSL